MCTGFWISFLEAGSAEASASVSMAVEFKERLILRVRTGAEVHEAAGMNQAGVTTQFRMEDNPVQIEVFSRIGNTQAIQLQVTQFGEPHPIQADEDDEIAWNASGEGFFDGILRKSQPQIMGTWIGPGKHEGTVFFRYLNPDQQKPDKTYTIRYSVIAL